MLKSTDQMNYLKQALDKSDHAIYLFDEAGNLIYNNSSRIFEVDSPAIQELQALVPDVLLKGNTRIIRKIKGQHFKITASRLDSSASRIAVFYVSLYNNLKLSEFNGLTIYNPQAHLNDLARYFYSESDYMKPVMERVKKASLLKQPVLISGEKGTGKDVIAELLHLNSNNKRNPMIIIDCKILTLNSWNSFVDSSESPINETNYSVFFKNINQLSLATQIAVFKYMESTALSKRHFVVASTGINLIDAVASNQFDYHLFAHLNSFSIQLPNLTDRRDDIPALMTLMLSDLNMELGKNIIGFDDPATLDLLKSFKWKYNIDQLKMIIRQLAIMTDTANISFANTQEVLRSSERQYLSERPTINFNQSIDEIERDIIKVVLHEEEMNQTNAAKRLGISRATLWRKLKNIE